MCLQTAVDRAVGEPFLFSVGSRNVETAALVSAASISGVALFISPPESLVFVTLTRFLDVLKFSRRRAASTFHSCDERPCCCELFCSKWWCLLLVYHAVVFIQILKSGGMWPHSTSEVPGRLQRALVGMQMLLAYSTALVSRDFKGIAFLIPLAFHFPTNYLSASLSFFFFFFRHVTLCSDGLFRGPADVS